MKFPSRLRTPIGAAVLSAIFPGLGQLAVGRRARGAIVAIPALTVVGAFLLIILFYRHDLLDAAFNQSWLVSLLLVDLVALIYHLWAIADSYLLARQPAEDRPKRRRHGTPARKWSATLAVAIIVSATVLVHGAFASVDVDWQNGLTCLDPTTNCFATFAPDKTLTLDTSNTDVSVVDPSGSSGPSGSGGSASPSASTVPTWDPSQTFDINQLPSFTTTTNSQNWAADGQFNVLLMGVDYEPGSSRTQGLRPDTMIVLHVDIASGRASMISVPRNTMCVPLPQAIAVHYAKSVNGCPPYTWGYQLNWLAGEAGWAIVTSNRANIKNFPFYQSPTEGQANDPLAIPRAATATMQAVAALTGLTMDGYVLINIAGLVTLIDDLGGIDINVPTRVYDMPCGPAGTWESKYRVCGLNPAHDGYQVPPSTPDAIDKMKATAAKSGGKQSITWSGGTTSGGTDIAFVIQPGVQHMDGNWALAYARTRIYTTDYDRGLRQQLVLKSLRSSFDPCTVLPRIPSLISDMSMFSTDLPLKDNGNVSQWVGIAQRVFGGNVQSFNLDPTTLKAGGATYITTTTWARAKDIVQHSLDKAPAATASSGSGGGGGGLGC
jgi:anionic cell wall polymer biosynthesis LytR-Cps2A-Psr (LCP) family protein